MHVRLRDSNIYKQYIEPYIPYWVDEIAKPCPDMNIKVVIFAVTQKFYNTKAITFK